MFVTGEGSPLGRMLGLSGWEGAMRYSHPADVERELQRVGAAAGSPDRGYYSFDIGEWHVVVLNSNTEPDCGL